MHSQNLNTDNLILQAMQSASLPGSCFSCLVTQLCPTFCNPMNCSLSDSSVYGISQARILERKKVKSLSSVQFSYPVVSDSSRPHEPQHASLPVHHQLLESTQTHVHRVGDTIQPSHPLSSPSPPALNLSQHQGLFKESTLHMRWPKYQSFNFNISPSNEHPGLISFRMYWLDLFSVQGILKSLL